MRCYRRNQRSFIPLGSKEESPASDVNNVEKGKKTPLVCLWWRRVAGDSEGVCMWGWVAGDNVR